MPDEGEVHWISRVLGFGVFLIGLEKEAAVYVDELGRLEIRFLVDVWVDNVTESARRRSDLNEALWRGLKKAGIGVTS